MRAQVSFALAISCSCIAQAQLTFEKVYLGGGAGRFNLIELSSQHVLTMLSYSSSVNVSGTSLLDQEGNMLHTRCYAIDTFLVLQSVRKFSDNDFFYVGGYYKDTCSTNIFGRYTYPVIGRMDSVGNKSNMRYYVLNDGECSKLTGDLTITSDKEIIVWGRDARFFTLKTDSTLAPIWAKQFNNYGGFQFIRELPGGDLLAGINMDTAGVVVARMDADGNFLWCKSYIRPKGMVHDVVIESDDSFIVTGYTDSIASTNGFIPLPPDYHPKLFMMKLDGEGAVQWCRGYDSEPKWYPRHGLRIEKALDGNYVVLANIGVQDRNRPYRPFLMKTDQNGDTLWTRSAGADGYAYATSDLLAYSDGGYLFNGIVYGSLPQNWTGAPYIFKTDSLGHLPCSEQYHPIQVVDLFPTDSSFVLISVDGAIAHPAFVSDTTFTPINVYDACTTTAVTNPMQHVRKFKVYPNPNSGRFTVEFADPLMAESYYSVYDAMGRLLFQRPLPKGSTMEEADLSRFGRGTYVIKFTDPDGVHHERVVLE